MKRRNMEIVAFILVCVVIAGLLGKKNGTQERGDNLKSPQNISGRNNSSSKNNRPYGPGTQYLKRSELDYEDIERLRREAEAYESQEHIELTANTIQELRLYVAEAYGVDPNKIDTLSDGRVLLDDQECGNWRYNVFGQLEYYHPARLPEYAQTHVQPGDSKNEFDDDFSDSFQAAKSKGKVIRGPW